MGPATLPRNKEWRAARLAIPNFGGDEEDRTPGLGIANAALSQLSYIPKM